MKNILLVNIIRYLSYVGDMLMKEKEKEKNNKNEWI